MDKKCDCGGIVGRWDTNKEDEHIYKDLGVCIDCSKIYLLTNNECKNLSKAEFRRILGARRAKLTK